MMRGEKFAIIADDYTGACDSGVHFSRAGTQIDLLLQEEGLGEQLLHCSNVSLTTESRFLAPGDAAQAVADIVRQCRAAGFVKFFKKVDSTLRGNPGSEIESALKATGHAAAILCPAIPEIGRTCIHGTIYLDGIPLQKTATGSDPFNPISTSSVEELLLQQTAMPAGTVSIADIESGGTALARRLESLVERGVKLIIADAATDTHLSVLAGQVEGRALLPAGAGGFARALAEIQKLPEKSNLISADAPNQGPILAVIGSLTDISRQQADLACSDGCFSPFEIDTRSTVDVIEAEFSRLFMEVDRQTPNILLRISNQSRPNRISKAEGERVARLLGDVAAVICGYRRHKTVFSTGGSTSMGVARALGIKSVTLVDEIMPGVVRGACTTYSSGVNCFISKAGGFGDKYILKNIVDGFDNTTTGV